MSSMVKYSVFLWDDEAILQYKSTRGLLATDHVILNHGQVTWTTPEMAPPLLTTTPTGGRFSSQQMQRASLPYTAGLWCYWARTRDQASHDPIPIPLGYRGPRRHQKLSIWRK
ncbi:hypothetical protein TNCV_1692221 [Trichonephila clavipes]|nr:hypothetical protein TNCV_1692221 [Trichonephila clavipes]